MRSTLLFTSLLSVLPVSLRLALKGLNPPIHLNQSIHSLYPRPPLGPVAPVLVAPVLALPLFKRLLCPTAKFIHTWDAASKHIHFHALSGSGSVTTDGCVRFANRIPSRKDEVPLLQGLGSITVENCITTCHAKKYGKGGVGRYKCCAYFTISIHSSTDPNFTFKVCNNIDRGKLLDDGDCKNIEYTCWGSHGEPPEFCGSHTSLVTYTM